MLLPALTPIAIAFTLWLTTPADAPIATESTESPSTKLLPVVAVSALLAILYVDIWSIPELGAIVRVLLIYA